MTTLWFLLGGAFVVGRVRWLMNWCELRARAQMLTGLALELQRPTNRAGQQDQRLEVTPWDVDKAAPTTDPTPGRSTARNNTPCGSRTPGGSTNSDGVDPQQPSESQAGVESAEQQPHTRGSDVTPPACATSAPAVVTCHPAVTTAGPTPVGAGVSRTSPRPPGPARVGRA